MKFDMSAMKIVVAITLSIFSGQSVAIRLPVRCELPPSSALFSPSHELTILHEDLQFDCSSEGCQVSAAYRISSKQQAAVKMSFISPSNQVESIAVNGADTRPENVLVAKFTDYRALYDAAKKDTDIIKDLLREKMRNDGADADSEYQELLKKYQAADRELDRLWELSGHNSLAYAELYGKLTKLEQLSPEQCSLPPDLTQPKGWEYYVTCLSKGNSLAISEILFGTKQKEWELYQINFETALTTGENTLLVRYFQPYSFAESNVAFFHSYPPIRYLTYELWPLKEWNLDPDFKIDLTVRLHNPPYGFLYMKRDGFFVSAMRFEDEKMCTDRNRTFEIERSCARIFNIGTSALHRSFKLSPITFESLPKNQLLYKTSLHGVIPDRLFIITGEGITERQVSK